MFSLEWHICHDFTFVRRFVGIRLRLLVFVLNVGTRALEISDLSLLRYRMAGITESAMVAYTHKYAVV